jgi:hypothetical protein
MLNLRGTAIGPAVSLSASSLQFGSVAAGDKAGGSLGHKHSTDNVFQRTESEG